MNAPDIVTLLERLNCSRVKLTGTKWVNASCPFAPYTDLHKNRQDAHPSFGVAIDDGKSSFRCFTCNSKGTLTHLLFRLKHLAEQAEQDTTGLTELFTWVQDRDREVPRTVETLKGRLKNLEYKRHAPVEIGGILVSEATAKNAAVAEVPEVILDEAELNKFDPLTQEARDYLRNERGLSDDTIAEWGFRWHPQSRRIAIPIRDCKGRLVGISGRALMGESKRKFLHSTGFKRDRYLFGENRLREGAGGRGIVVEGFFDAIYLWQQGYPAVALLGTTPSILQAEKLVRFFSEVIVFPDGDGAGYEGAKKVVRALERRVKTSVAPIPPGRDPDELSPLELLDLLGDPR